MRLSVALAALTAVSLSSLAHAGTIRHDVDDTEYTSGLSPAFDGVGKLFLDTPSGSFACTATVIATDAVLTAGHCVADATALQFELGGLFDASEWTAHPKFRAGSLARGNDLAIVTFPDEVFAPELAATLYDGSLGTELGQVGVSVGYGTTGTGISGWLPDTYGTLRRGHNMIDRYGSLVSGFSKNMLVSDFDRLNDATESLIGSADPLDLEYLIAPGDSGGPLYITADDGVQYLAGVHSFGLAGDGAVDSDYGDLSFHTQVSAFTSWIEGTLSGGGSDDDGGPNNGGGNGNGKGNGRPFVALEGNLVPMIARVSAAQVPEPSSVALGLLASAGLLCRRGRTPRVESV